MKLAIQCPKMKVFPVDADTRITEEIFSPMQLTDCISVLAEGSLYWPKCLIKRHFALYWVVNKVIAVATLEGALQGRITLDPEGVLGPFALPVPAYGSVFDSRQDTPVTLSVKGKFPHAIALPLGDGVWEVQEVHATLDVCPS